MDTTVEHDSINTFVFVLAYIIMLLLWLIITSKCEISVNLVSSPDRCWGWLVGFGSGTETSVNLVALGLPIEEDTEKKILALQPVFIEARRDLCRQLVASKGIELSTTFAWTRQL